MRGGRLGLKNTLMEAESRNGHLAMIESLRVPFYCIEAEYQDMAR